MGPSPHSVRSEQGRAISAKMLNFVFNKTEFEESHQSDYMGYREEAIETFRITRHAGLRRTIAFCGLDCEKCDAYIATKNDDQALREKTAKLWSELNNTPILPEHINCDGCRINGRKTVFCDRLCPVRQCALSKCFETCGACPENNTCPKVGIIWQHNPQAKNNLESI